MGLPRVGQENKFVTRCFKLQFKELKIAHFKDHNTEAIVVKQCVLSSKSRNQF